MHVLLLLKTARPIIRINLREAGDLHSQNTVILYRVGNRRLRGRISAVKDFRASFERHLTMAKTHNNF